MRWIPPWEPEEELKAFIQVRLNNKNMKTFYDIPAAAELAGFSLRHFRRIMEEEKIPILRIGRKFFVLGVDLAVYLEKKGGEKDGNS